MSLIAHYPLTDNSNDYSGNQYNMTLDEILTPTNDGKIGKCYTFAGDGKHISCSQNFKSEEMSFAFWVNVSQTSYGTTIFRMTDDCLAADYSYNHFRFFMYGTDNQPYVCEFPDTEVNIWNHFVCIYKPGLLSVYKNGEFKKSFSVSLKPRDGGYRLTVGCRGDREFPLQGKLNDFRVYSHALSLKEIKELVKAKVLHYKFDDFQEPTTNMYASRNQMTAHIVTPTWIDEHTVRFSSAGGTSGIYFNERIIIKPGSTYTVSYKLRKISGRLIHIRGHLPTDKLTLIETLINGKPVPSIVGTNALPDTTETHEISYTFEPLETMTNMYYCWIQPNFNNDTVVEAEVFDIQIEEKDHPTPFVIGSRTGKIKDCSGYNHHSLPLEEATTPRWIDGHYSFTKGNLIKHPNPFLGQNNLLQEWTVCAWVNIDPECGTYAGLNSFNLSNRFIQETTPLLYLNNGTNDYYTYGKLLPKDKWIHVAYVFRNSDGLRKIYCNGEDYSTSGPNATSIPSGLQDIILVGQNFTGLLDDYRIYATVLDKDSIKDIYLRKTSIDKSGKVFTNSISVPENRFLKMDKAIQAKQYKDGLTSYEQANCKCTLTDDGFRIFRAPNLNYPDIGNTIWGGLRLVLPGETIQPDRKYKLLFDYKGQSSNHFDIYFARQIGWTTQGGLKGLYPQTSKNLPKDNHNSTEWQTAEISFKYSRSDIYQVATKTEGLCTQGETYNCASEFKIGYGYTSTGALGTDMYIKNIRLYDITDGDATVDKSGIKASAINEIGVVRDLIAYYPFDKDSKDYSGNKHHLDGTYVSIDGIKNQAIKIDGMASGIKTKLAFPASGTVSAWGKNPVKVAGQMLFSFDTDIYGPDLYFAHDVVSWNTSDGGGNPFIKNGIPQGYPSANEWHHYVVVMDAVKNKVTLYIDGEYCGDAKYVSPEQPNTKNFIIGSSEALNTYIWKGDIDNVKVSTACWSPQEVKIEYETTANKKVLINKDGTIYAGSFDEVSI